MTAPYMHDGSVATLSDVLDNYASGGPFPDTPHKASLVMGLTLSGTEKADVIAFLQSLTDEVFLTNPRFADPWPDGHPASSNRTMP